MAFIEPQYTTHMSDDGRLFVGDDVSCDVGNVVVGFDVIGVDVGFVTFVS